jgi:hypothetical protein
MDYKYPVTFDEPVGGVDASGGRVTNIVGFDGRELIKQCPKCRKNWPASMYGPSGRPSGGAYERRDQADCHECR